MVPLRVQAQEDADSDCNKYFILNTSGHWSDIGREGIQKPRWALLILRFFDASYTYKRSLDMFLAM